MQNSKLSTRFKSRVLNNVHIGFLASAQEDSLDDTLHDMLAQKIASIPVWDEYSDDEKRDLISIFVDNKSITNSDIDRLKASLYQKFV